MGPLARLGTWVALLLALGASESCSSSGGSGESCSPALEPAANELLTDGSGETLAKAVLEYQPTDDELKLVAAYWALLAVGYQDGAVASAFFDARLDEQVAAVMVHYPSFVSCPEGGGASGGVPTVPTRAPMAVGGCTCGESCLPSSMEVGSLLLEVGGLGMEIFSHTPQAAAVVAKLRFYADDVVTKVDAAKNLTDSFSTYDATRAITEGVTKESAMKVLEGVGEFVVVAGTIAGAAAAAGAAAPSLPVIAAVGAVVGAGMVGVKIGTKLGDMMDGFEACTSCQAKNCDPGTGGSGGGGSECAVPCSANEVCLEGQCVPKNSTTTCELRVPSCCPGHDDSCTAPDAACYCDAYCVTAGDCCPDACAVCGYCG